MRHREYEINQLTGSFEFVDAKCEDNCANKCYEGKMAGIFSVGAFGKMELRLQYTGRGYCFHSLAENQEKGQLGGFRIHGWLHAPSFVPRPGVGLVTFDDCVITNLPPSGVVTEITVSAGYSIAGEHSDGNISFSEFKVGIDGLLQWGRVNSIDVQPDIPGQGHWKIESKSAYPISHQFEDVRIEFVPVSSPPKGDAAFPGRYTIWQGMLVRFVYSDNIPLKDLMESTREFQDFLAFALNRPVMVRSAEGSYPENGSTSASDRRRGIRFPSQPQPEIDIMGIYKGDYSSLFVYDQIDDFVNTFTAWRKLRSEVGDPFFGSIVDMYIKRLYGSRLDQDLLVDYMKIIELMQRKFKGMDKSELRQWNWNLGRFPQGKDLMVAPYWDKFFSLLLEGIGYASTPKEFGETARKLRNAVVHPVDAAAKLKEIGIKEGDKRALEDYIGAYAKMYERLVQLYLVTLIGLDPTKLRDEGNLFATVFLPLYLY